MLLIIAKDRKKTVVPHIAVLTISKTCLVVPKLSTLRPYCWTFPQVSLCGYAFSLAVGASKEESIASFSPRVEDSSAGKEELLLGRQSTVSTPSFED